MPDYYGALTYAVRLPDGELRDCLLAVDGEFDGQIGSDKIENGRQQNDPGRDVLAVAPGQRQAGPRADQRRQGAGLEDRQKERKKEHDEDARAETGGTLDQSAADSSEDYFSLLHV